jgi:hypothetical protein
MDVQEDTQFGSDFRNPRRTDLSGSSFDMIFGGMLSSAQQQLEKSFRELRERSEEFEAALGRAQEKNEQLEQRNAELVAELAGAQERAAQLETLVRLAADQSYAVVRTLSRALEMQPATLPPDPIYLRTMDSPPPPMPANDEPTLDADAYVPAVDPGDDAPAAHSDSPVEEPVDLPGSQAEDPTAPSDASDEAGNQFESVTMEDDGDIAALALDLPAEMPAPLGGPGLTHLVASHFDSLAAVLRFQREVRQLPGVLEVKPVDFHDGVIRLAVSYSSEMDHLSALLGLSGYDLRLVAPSDEVPELRVESGNGSHNGAIHGVGLMAG